MSDPSAKITARRVDTDVAVIGAGPAGLALLGSLANTALSIHASAHGGALLTRVNRWLG
jgi:NADPH-dependent glutamate synthase beta subunit-like oxidoreductase